ncbi:MAG: ATP-binding protein, partial [Kineosporiaceae bacterium]
LEEALRSEFGIGAGEEAVLLRDTALATPSLPVSQRTDDAAPAARAGAKAPVRAAGLVERDAELAELTHAVTTALQAGRGLVVLVSGEPGSGKSALVRELLDTLEPGVTTFFGGCDDLLAARSLGPFRDMAEEHEALSDVISGEQLGDALPALLRTVARQPSLVVVEDAHWADDATLDAIRYLSRRISRIPVGLVLTYRDTDVDTTHPLRRVLGGLAGLPVTRMTLRPLTPRAIERLGAASPGEAAEIHRVTRGNPFFVTEVLAAPDADVPETVRDAILARLGRLDPRVQAFLRRLSVVPTRCERWLAAHLADGDPDLLLEAERSGMVLADTDALYFRHELARHAVETSLLAGERLEADRAVVAALLGHPGVDRARVVHHAARSGQIDLVLEHAPVAAREASRLGAHRQAAEMLRVVLEHPSRLTDRQLADLTTQRAYSLYVVNRYEAALACARSAVTAAGHAGDGIALGDALLVLARVGLFARGPSAARQASRRAVDVLTAAGDDARLAAALSEMARAHSNLPTVGIVADVCESAATHAERALVLAERLGRSDIAAQAWCYLGDARSSAGDPRGAADLERAIALAATDNRLETTVRCYVNAAGAAYRAGRPDDAQRYVADGLRCAADGEFFAGEYRLRLTGAMIRASGGDWETAVTELRSLVYAGGEPGVMAVLARAMLARLLARQGAVEAGDVLAGALTDPEVAEDGLVAGSLAVASVEIGWLDGTLGDLTSEVRRAIGLAAGAGHHAVHAELCAYLRRAGVEVPRPSHRPGPWAATLAGRWQDAAAAWSKLGERYEHAVVLATAPDREARARGQRLLESLGAVATMAAT